jgi:acetyltransferase-like isoleucine patch superfamily enzyme
MTNPLREAWLHCEDPINLYMRARSKLYSLWLSKTYPFVSVGRKLSVHFPCAIRRPFASRIKLGNDVIIGKDTFIYIEQDGGKDIKLVIDDNSSIGARSFLSAKNLIHIGRDVIMGTGVLIQDHQHAQGRADVPIRDQGVTPGGKIRIEQGCWIGNGAVIVCNEGERVIGRNSVIAANSVVARNVPPYSVIVGNPGIVVKRSAPPVPAAVSTTLQTPTVTPEEKLTTH